MGKKGVKGKAKQKKKSIMTNEKEIKGIVLGDYIGTKLEKALNDEFEIAHVMPVGMVICTCGPQEENVKLFFLKHSTSKDYEQKKLVISSESKITEKDLKKLKNAFKKGKYKR